MLAVFPQHVEPPDGSHRTRTATVDDIDAHGAAAAAADDIPVHLRLLCDRRHDDDFHGDVAVHDLDGIGAAVAGHFSSIYVAANYARHARGIEQHSNGTLACAMLNKLALCSA